MKLATLGFGVLCLVLLSRVAEAQSITLLLNSKTITGVANNTPLNTWTGDVGSASRVGTLTAPTYLSSSSILPGMPGVRFGNTTNATTSTNGQGMVSTLSQGSGAYTVMAVYRYNNNPGGTPGKRVLNGYNGGAFGNTANNWLVGPYTGQHMHYANGWVNNPGSSATTGPALVTAMNTAIGAGTSSFYVNGLIEVDDANPDGLFGTLGLGAAGGYTEGADSDLGLVLAFNSVLTNDQRVGVEYIIARQFGLPGFSATTSQINAGIQLLQGTSLMLPEPSTYVVWSLVGVIGAIGCYRARKRTAR
jgi:hypothetical protein